MAEVLVRNSRCLWVGFNKSLRDGSRALALSGMGYVTTLTNATSGLPCSPAMLALDR
ncbi:MAG: hypothetical protein HPY83_08050 [Anaerolineae bacterium]|nr:hypothetical protein [Anaerolineae bacterium]